MKTPLRFALLLMAAGVGRRFSGGENQPPKQRLSIRGKPVFVHALERFLGVDNLHAVVVHPKGCGWGELFAADLEAHGLADRVGLVGGDSERFLSVYKGLCSLKTTTNSWVFVHDAARPCLHGDDLRSVVERIRISSASTTKPFGVVPVSEVSSTIKAVSNKNRITKHLDRSRLVEAATPQAFPLDSLRRAYELWLEAEPARTPTDDAEVFALLDHPIYTVRLRHPNPKLTRPEDWRLVEDLLA